ncbi:hypothetical protein GCM10010969_30980 [Saccharibacillus kuerlensis]|uniref:Uncharacterized protein n=1 Tax=Saccharibacillus kuerlensis TaxID=459527 RepID=A0ABQ2L6C8_9BACL|nr:hypothetical protein GCM10010969_30980 [Saccharibacillus kuerlensis]
MKDQGGKIGIFKKLASAESVFKCRGEIGSSYKDNTLLRELPFRFPVMFGCEMEIPMCGL